MQVLYHVIAVAPSLDELRLIQDLLFPEGIEVQPACCLRQALLNYQEAAAPVILYDTETKEPWREALAQFLGLGQGVRVVFVSRLADEHMWIEVLEAGGYDLLIKPFQPAEIRWVVRNALTPRPPALSKKLGATAAA